MSIGAPLGNENAAKGRRWRDALNKALARYSNPARQVSAGEALDKIAHNVVDAAVKGDKACIDEIATRLDGKAPQAHVGGDEDSQPIKHAHKVQFLDGASTAAEEA